MAFSPILVDGFDNYAGGTQRWTLGSSMTCSLSRSRHAWGQGAENTGFSGIGFPWIELPQVSSLIFEGAFNLRLFAGGLRVLSAGKLGVTSGDHVELRLSDSKHPYIVNPQSGAVIAGPTVGPEHVMELGLWYWFQFHVIPHDSAGYVKFSVNGDTWLEASGVDTKHGSFDPIIDQFKLAHGATSNYWYDDFVWQDGDTGQFMGDMIVIGKRPISAGYITQFDVVGAASNYLAVDEVAADDDTTYVTSDIEGERDSYIIEDITEVPESSVVLGVQQAIRHRKDEPGPRSVTPFIRVDTDEITGQEWFPSETAYLTSIEDVHILQPDGVSEWGTVGEFNALDVEIGQEVGDGLEDS